MRWTAILLLGLSTACGDAGFDGGGGFGAQTGGVKDLQSARDLVAAGIVPPAEALLVEGMFAEHDLALDGPPCDRTLCLRAALGIAPDEDGSDAAWFQVGLSSTIDPATFERPPLAFVATVDVSGSMDWGNEGSPGEVARALLHALIDRLEPGDQLAIVTYGAQVRTAVPFTDGGARESLHDAVDSLVTGGATNMEAGLLVAYDLAAEVDARVLLFTDEQPNVGATSASEFEEIVRAGADEGAGITIFGLGLALDQGLMNEMADLRGGNAFTLTRVEQVAPFVEDEWPWFAVPIAYDLRLEVTPRNGFVVADAYGFPGDPSLLEAKTVFLSRRKGALLVKLTPPGGFDGLHVDARATYTDVDGTVVDQPLAALYNGQIIDLRGQFFEQRSTAKTVALALLMTQLYEGAEIYVTNPSAAGEIMHAARDRFAADIALLDDAALDAELVFVDALVALVDARAPQAND